MSDFLLHDGTVSICGGCGALYIRVARRALVHTDTALERRKLIGVWILDSVHGG
jgi:hypothetical protein